MVTPLLLLVCLLRACPTAAAIKDLAALAKLFSDGSLTEPEFVRAKTLVLDSWARRGDPVPEALNLTRWRGKRVLFVGAHDDDVATLAGGLAFTLGSDPDVETAHFTVTDSADGGLCYINGGTNVGDFYACPSESLSHFKALDAEAEGVFMNYTRVFRGGFRSGMTVSYPESQLREKITGVVRYFRPHVVISHYPFPNFHVQPSCNGKCMDAFKNKHGAWADLGYHPDHKAVGLHVFNTVYSAGSSGSNHFDFDELALNGAEGWKVEELYMYALTAGGEQPLTHFFELDAALVGIKGDALAFHRSAFGLDPPRSNAQWLAEQVGLAVGVPYAEAFQAYF